MATLYVERDAKEEDLPEDIKELINSISVPKFDMDDEHTFHQTFPPLSKLYPDDTAAAAKHLYAHLYKVMEMWGYPNPTGEIFLDAPDNDSERWIVMWEAGPSDWAMCIFMSNDKWYIDADTCYSVIFSLLRNIT
ncbi:MAG: hypothetical protein B6I36_10955 [Desulfobacteraceae bacterium 4572_35.1]|nr:MAG: hypothetical protein B6I36_10955 [Desulfobacteraceae bacterium 4572_35.1]